MRLANNMYDRDIFRVSSSDGVDSGKLANSECSN